MKKILIVHGHPDNVSFNFALGNEYKNGAQSAGAEVQEIIIRDLKFNPNLQFGYRKRTELEPDLLEAWGKIKWADHIVIIHPVWWGSVPAILKGFIDRLFLPGFVFQKRENSLWWDKLLKGKSGHIICTLDQPGWFYRLRFGQPSIKALKKMTFQFSGIQKVKTTAIGPIRLSKDSFRENWLKKVNRMGAKVA